VPGLLRIKCIGLPDRLLISAYGYLRIRNKTARYRKLFE
jgi:hypothetical protein